MQILIKMLPIFELTKKIKVENILGSFLVFQDLVCKTDHNFLGLRGQ